VVAQKLKIYISGRWWFILLTIIITVVIVVIGLIYFHSQVDLVRERQNIEFNTIAKLKINQLVQWQNERRSDVVAISRSPLLTGAVERLLVDKNNTELKEAISKQISLFQKEFGYEDILLTTCKGELLLSAGLKPDHFDMITSEKIAEAVVSQKIAWTDLYYCNEGDKIHDDIIAPIVNENDMTIAILVFRIDPNNYLYPLIQSWPTPSKTSETILVRKGNDSVVFLNELRYLNNTALKFKIPLTAKEIPAVQAVLGYTGFLDGKDYRGVDVVANIQKVPNGDWFMVVKMDKSEVYDNLYREAKYIIIWFSLILLLVITGLAFFYNYRQRYIYKGLWNATEEHSTTLQSIGDAVISTDKKGIVQFMNKVAEHLTGWGISEAKGKNLLEVFEIINEETRTPIISAAEKVIQAKKTIGLTNHTILISKDGREFSITECASPIKRKDGEIIGVVLVFKDQTEAREAQMKVNASESRYRRLFESAKEGIIILDAETGMINDVNPFLVELLGYTKEQFIEKAIWDIGFFKDIIANQDKFSELQKQDYIRYEDLPLETADGKQISVEFVSNVYSVNSHKVIQCNIRDITERKQVEEALRTSEAYLSNAVTIAKLSYWEYDVINDLFTFNDQFYDIFHTTAEEVGGYKMSSEQYANRFVHPDDISLVSTETRKAIETTDLNFSRHLEHRIIYHDGEIGYISVRFFIVKDSQGRTIKTYGVNQDITERKKLENEFKDSEIKYRGLFENSSEFLFTLDLKGNFTDMNNAAEVLTGYSKSELLKMNFKDYTPKKDHRELFRTLSNIYKTGKPFQNLPITAIMKDGSIKYFETSFTLLKKGKQSIGFQGSSKDITVNKLRGDALQVSEAQYRDLVEKGNIAIAVDDINGNLFYCNDQFLKLFGYSAEEIKSKTHEILVYPDDFEMVAKYHEKRMQGKEVPSRYEFRGMRKDGSIVNIEIDISEILTKDGEFSGSRSYFWDITKRKKAEQNLITALEKATESDRLKSAFLANMSHEIRTPMNGILGFAQLLREPDLTGEEQQNFLGIIEKSGARMLNIITDIVSISKIESGQMEISVSETNVNEQINFVYNFFKPAVEEDGIQLIAKTALPLKEAIIKTDREKIYSILTNLVGNATKFTHAGSIEFGYEKKGKYLEFFIKDSGVGIADDKKELIFTRFRQGSESLTRNYEGAGLGLSISKAYVEILGGKIWVESELGKGSTFYFTIPYNAAKEPEIVTKESVSREDEEGVIKNLKILIAEDDESSELFLSTALTKFDKELLIARTGVEAVEACRNNPDLDLVLMDVRMPDMNGYEVTRIIREFNKDVVIIAQTAYGLIGDKQKAIEAGCTDYISKPIDVTLLKAIIQKYFNK